MKFENFLTEIIGQSYQNYFDNMLNMRIYKNCSDNLLFCSYVFNNNLMSLNDLKIFKSNINKNGLKIIIDIIRTIDILEIEYIKNKSIIMDLEKKLSFYMNIDNN